MSHTEIEPWAAKTLLLLRSTDSNALEDLRTMLMETIHQKYNGKKQYKLIPPLSGPIAEPVAEKTKPKESKASSVESKPKTIAPPATASPARSGGFSPSINLASPDSYGSDSENSSSENSEMVILEAEPSCAVCKEMTRAPWNELVECSECHASYHQQCHNPNISEAEVSDPRTVWYCRNCTKTMNKAKPASSSSSSSKDSKSSSSKPASGRSNTASPSFGSKTFGGGNKAKKKGKSKEEKPKTSIALPEKRTEGLMTPKRMWYKTIGWKDRSNVQEYLRKGNSVKTQTPWSPGPS